LHKLWLKPAVQAAAHCAYALNVHLHYQLMPAAIQNSINAAMTSSLIN
jgi:hypothetical protein